MDYTATVIKTPDGRSLEVAAVGDPRGATALFHHGTPGSAPLAKLLANVANDAGVFVVTTSRAGYGPSDRMAARNVVDVVPDARSALDHFDRDHYVAVGWSGGGPHALACGALDVPRCRGVVSIAGVAPSEGDFDWTAGMGQENVDEFELAKRGGEEYEEYTKVVADVLSEATAENLPELFGGLISPVDASVFDDPGTSSLMCDSFRHGLKDTPWGIVDDDQSFLRPWGFQLADVTVPCEVWFGDHDLMVPASHGRYLVANLPNVRAEHWPDDGHISLFMLRMSRMMDHVLRLADEV
jgi:pimeloyl-ACP methyl ester carboxylesterase